MGCGDGSGLKPREESVRQTGVAVIECKEIDCFGLCPHDSPNAREIGKIDPSRLAVAHLNLKLSRFSWSTDRQPISFMSRSISARRLSNPPSTAARPAAAKTST